MFITTEIKTAGIKTMDTTLEIMADISKITTTWGIVRPPNPTTRQRVQRALQAAGAGVHRAVAEVHRAVAEVHHAVVGVHRAVAEVHRAVEAVHHAAEVDGAVAAEEVDESAKIDLFGFQLLECVQC